MASFQIPQFLDAGDKIIGPLGFRQFGWALGGFLVAVFIYQIVILISPQAGWVGFIPASPPIILVAYMALGKFNGRDADIYVGKYIIFSVKQKRLTYVRSPFVQDLNSTLADLTPEKIKKRWEKQVTAQKVASTDKLHEFTKKGSAEKAELIRDIGGNVDYGNITALNQVKRGELAIEAKKAIVDKIRNQNQGRR